MPLVTLTNEEEKTRLRHVDALPRLEYAQSIHAMLEKEVKQLQEMAVAERKPAEAVQVDSATSAMRFLQEGLKLTAGADAAHKSGQGISPKILAQIATHLSVGLLALEPAQPAAATAGPSNPSARIVLPGAPVTPTVPCTLR